MEEKKNEIKIIKLRNDKDVEELEQTLLMIFGED